MKIEVAVQGSQSLISLKVSVDINHHERRTRQFATRSRCSMTWPSAVAVDRYRVGQCSVYVPAVSPTVYVRALSPAVYVPAVSPAVYVPAVSPTVYLSAVSPTAVTVSPTGTDQAGVTVKADPSPTCRRLAAGNGQVCCTAVAPGGSWCSRPRCR